jgi:hypothetical protein
MPFLLETITTTDYNILNNIVSKFKISNNTDSGCYEKNISEDLENNLLQNIIKRALLNQTRLHILYDTKNNIKIPCGLIALNFEVVGEFSALSIDLIFVSMPYRNKYFSELNTKISSYLLEFSLYEAIQMNSISKLDAVLLTPINECVKQIYLDFGFEEMTDDWLYFSIDRLID